MSPITANRLWLQYRVARASRYSAPENPADGLPIVVGDLTTPARTESGVYVCPKIDTAGSGTYCVADSRIEGSVSLFDDDGIIAGGDYVVNTSNDFQGQGIITTAIFSVPPNGPVSAVCRGRVDSGLVLIENMALVIRDLMLNVWGFTEQDLNNASFSVAKSDCENLGYDSAGVIIADHAPAEIIAQIVESFFSSAFVGGDKRLNIIVNGIEIGRINPVAFLPRDSAAERSSSVDGIVNIAPVFYGWNERAGQSILHEDGEATKNGASIRLFGERIHPSDPFTLKWTRKTAAVQRMQQLMVERYADAADIATLTIPNSRMIQVEQGDYLYYTIDWSLDQNFNQRTNQIGEVVSITYDMREQTQMIILRETQFFLTSAEIADGSFIADGSILAGGARDSRFFS